jgi:hypothetical protein
MDSINLPAMSPICNIEILAYVEFVLSRAAGRIIIVIFTDHKTTKSITFTNGGKLLINSLSEIKPLTHTGHDRHPIILVPKSSIVSQGVIDLETKFFCHDDKREISSIGWNVSKNIMYYRKDDFRKLKNINDLNAYVATKDVFDNFQMCIQGLKICKLTVTLIGNYTHMLNK